MRRFLPLAALLASLAALPACTTNRTVLQGLSTAPIRLPISTASYGGSNYVTLIASAAACSAVPCADKSVALVFSAPQSSGRTFQTNEVLLTVDGQETTLRTLQGDQSQSVVRLVLDGLSFARFATGNNVRVTLGSVPVNLTPDALVTLRALATRLAATQAN